MSRPLLGDTPVLLGDTPVPSSGRAGSGRDEAARPARTTPKRHRRAGHYARTTDPALTQRFADALGRESLEHAAAARVERASFETLSDGAPAACDPELRSALRAGARDLGLGETDLPSGAGHDAAFMSRICPSAMVFVPCRAGKSHAPEEWASREAIAAGAAVIFQAVRGTRPVSRARETATGGLIGAVNPHCLVPIIFDAAR